ncbi:hypothetical protein GCM10009825_38550 [Arthrobacter humicola]|uniref:Uncharacterized protein n=1 Tax=Arthrobacter humicola TaxID=409291 RepID=A0ABN2ZPW0_9MICC
MNMEAAGELLPKRQPEPGCHVQETGLRYEGRTGRDGTGGHGGRSCAHRAGRLVGKPPALSDPRNYFLERGTDRANGLELLLLDLQSQEWAATRSGVLWGLGQARFRGGYGLPRRGIDEQEFLLDAERPLSPAARTVGWSRH